MDNSNYGILLNAQNLELQRFYFKECVRLQGIYVVYQAPRKDKHYNEQSEIVSNYYDPEKVGCLFNEHPNQYTLKKLGWVSELNDQPAIISVPYDLHNLQQGALFTIPSAIDGAEGRTFRVVEMSTIMIYPASITCKLVPEYTNELASNLVKQFKQNNFTLMKSEDN